MRTILLATALLAGCVNPDAPVNPGDDAERIYEVPAGSAASNLGPALLAEGLVPSELQWKLFLRQADASCLKAGPHHVRGSMSLNELLESLCSAPVPDDVPFTVIEGWRIQDIDKALAAKGWIEAGAYAKTATNKSVSAPFEITSPTLEGYLYPETYMVSPSAFSAEGLIQRQLATFQERFLSKHADNMGERSLHEVVVMASMLEREEPKPENRPLVAGILWKRIDTGNALGVDATSRYDLENWNDRSAFIKNLKDPDHAYNTRMKKGLPPTAIGNPTVSSLEAAISPERSEFWYYLHDGDGNLHPSRNAAEHDAKRDQYGVH